MTSSRPSRRGPTIVALFESGEQTAHKLADFVVDRFAADEIAVGLLETGAGRWRVTLHFGVAPDQAAIRTAIAAVAGARSAKTLRFARIAATDWVRASLAGLTPVAAGCFVVHGGHDRARVLPNRIGIEIEAGLAFGTGHHGTTRGCLLALDRLCKAQHRRDRLPRILDLGTGSGVLAIAAARSLHAPVLATDIDADAVRIARANAALNRAAPLIAIVHAPGVGTASVRRCAPFDLVFANILLRPLQRLAAPLKRLIAPSGHLVLSGLLAAQANAAIAAYRPLVLERRLTIDGWTTLVFVRRMA